MVDIDRKQEEDDLLGELTPDEDDEYAGRLTDDGPDIDSEGSADLNPTHTVGPSPPDAAEEYPNRLDNLMTGRPHLDEEPQEPRA